MQFIKHEHGTTTIVDIRNNREYSINTDEDEKDSVDMCGIPIRGNFEQRVVFYSELGYKKLSDKDYIWYKLRMIKLLINEFTP